MTAATLAALALLLAAPSPRIAKPSPHAKRSAPNQVFQKRATLTDADVRRLVQDWTTFESAMATLQDSVPVLPQGGASPEDLEQAEAAWAADARIRRALESNGTTPEAFLGLYRQVAEAWWALLEVETREHTATGLAREIEALRATKGEEAADVAAELEKGLKSLDQPRKDPPDLDVVRDHRAELAKIFSPAEAGP